MKALSDEVRRAVLQLAIEELKSLTSQHLKEVLEARGITVVEESDLHSLYGMTIWRKGENLSSAMIILNQELDEEAQKRVLTVLGSILVVPSRSQRDRLGISQFELVRRAKRVGEVPRMPGVRVFCLNQEMYRDMFQEYGA